MDSGGGEDLSVLLEFAVQAAQAAGALTLRHFGGRVADQAKADGTPVTTADQEAERILREQILARFPHDGILGEEGGHGSPGRSGRRWIVDPIDGTRAFMRGVPLYAVLVALERGGVPVLGVAHFPALGETVAAAEGQGCYRDGIRCRVNQVRHLQDAVALTSDPGFTAVSPVGPGWSRLTAQVSYTRSWGDAYGHCMVATGRAEIMLDPAELAPWDAAPLLPILREAGGRFTDLAGNETVHGGSGLSTNGLLHSAVMDTLCPDGA
ncbi:MAG: histidinol phosphate phosphatase [Gemmatimonadales bacterium]|nr:MAG: histidinol phosphate phosphatase [Gemmatimonadales bacterium]